MRRCKNKLCDDEIRDEAVKPQPGLDLVYVSKYCPACRAMGRRAWLRACTLAGIVCGVIWFLVQTIDPVLEFFRRLR